MAGGEASAWGQPSWVTVSLTSQSWGNRGWGALGGFSLEAGGELRLGEAGGTGWAKRIWAVHRLGLGRESPR